MDRQVYRKTAYMLLYLIRCVLADTDPDVVMLLETNLADMLEVAKDHSLSALAACGLDKAGIHNRSYEEARLANIRKNIILDREREQVISQLEKAGIWHMPLKGCVIKDLYSDPSMREMADNDILCDPDKMAQVRGVMESLGFTAKVYGKSHQDVYYKPPLCNFEMHSRLIEPRYEPFYSYLHDIREKLVADEDNAFGYHFAPSDLYIYCLIHEYKHFAECGTGLRSLVDTFVILRRYDGSLDWEYISRELSSLGINDFEINNRALVNCIFGSEGSFEKALSHEQAELLDRYIFAGTYGNMDMRISNADLGSPSSKIRYVFDRLKLDEQTLKEFHPFFYRHRALRPFLYAYRLGNKMLTGRAALKSEVAALLGKHGTSRRTSPKFSYRRVLKRIAAGISKTPAGGIFKYLYDVFVLGEYGILCMVWQLRSDRLTKKQKREVARKITFIYKSFERQDMAKRLFRSIQAQFPGARVIIADDSSTPLRIRSPYCRVIQLPFNSGLSFGLNRALAEVDTPYTMKLDDDELLTPLSKIYQQLVFLEKHSSVDLCAIQALSAPFELDPVKMAEEYRRHSMAGAAKKLIVPHWTRVDRTHIISGKVPNVFLARTDKYRAIGYDDNIRMTDHHEFFFRSAGNIVSAMDTSAFVFHYHNWFDLKYAGYRNDTAKDAAYIRRKHGGSYR